MNLRDKKELGLIVFTLGVGILEFLIFSLLIEATANWLVTAILVVISIVWLAVVTFTLSLTQRKWSLWLLNVGSAVTVLVAGRFSSAAIGGAVLLLLFMFLAYRSFGREVANRITYKASDVFPPGLKTLMMGLLFALLALSLPHLQGSIEQNRIQVTEKNIDPLLKPFERVIASFLPGYFTGATVDEILKASIAQQSSQLPAGFSVDPNQLAISRAQISKQVGYQLTGQETISGIVAGFINHQVTNATRSSPLIVILILLAIVFLTLRATIPFLVWPVLALVMFLVWIGRKAELVYLARTPTVIERIQL